MALEGVIEALGGARTVAPQQSRQQAIGAAALRDLADPALGADDSPAQQAEREQAMAKAYRMAAPQGGAIAFDATDRGTATPASAAQPWRRVEFGETGQGTDLDAAIGELSGASAKAETKASASNTQKVPLGMAKPGERTVDDLFSPGSALRLAGSYVAAPGAAILGGWRALATLASGGSVEDAANAANATSQAVAFEPRNAGERTVAAAAGSGYNPLNWIPMAGDWAGGKTTDIATRLGASPEVAAGAGATVNTAINAAPLLLTDSASLNKPVFAGPKAVPTVTEVTSKLPVENLETPAYLRARQSGGTPLQSVTAAPVAAKPAGLVLTEKASTTAPKPVNLGIELPKAGTLAAAVESEPVKGGLPAAVQSERAAVLQRLGIKNAWKSSIEGDAMGGAVNAQTVQFKGHPAAAAAADQFAHETQAIKTAAAQVAERAGGVLGDGQTAELARGRAIADYGDKIRTYFDRAESQLYKIADERTKGMPVVTMQPVEDLLGNRTFKNSIAAQDKSNLLSAISDQLEVFKENNPGGLTVQNAEQFRQWLNQQWSPSNSRFIAQVKTAVDRAVTRAAGEDVYKASRDMHILKKATLDNPKGVARIFDVDPQTPTNRAVRIENLANEAEKMSFDHFRELVDTLRTKTPPELRGQAASAEAQLKAHFVQGILDAGTPNTKTPSPFWNNRKVNDYFRANEEKMRILFSKEEQARLADVRAGGNIIAVDASYPGAAAQAEIGLKQGLLGRVISPAMTSVGGGVGTAVGSLVGAPVLGGGAGAVLGRAAGEKMSTAAAERAAMKKMQQRIIPLSEVGK